jgi:integrase
MNTKIADLDSVTLKSFELGTREQLKDYIKKSNPVILNEYKTVATNGTQTTKLPAKFARIIWSYLESTPQKKYLFTTKNSLEKPFSSADTFGRYVRDTFASRLDKNVSVDLLRHSFITHLRKGDLSKAKKKKIAMEMGHSLDQQENYRKN